MSRPPRPSAPGQARVPAGEDEHGGPDHETGKNDHPERHGLSQDAAGHEGSEQGTRACCRAFRCLPGRTSLVVSLNASFIYLAIALSGAVTPSVRNGPQPGSVWLRRDGGAGARPWLGIGP